MIIQTTDFLPITNPNLPDSQARAAHHTVCVGGCEGFSAEMRAVKPDIRLFGYLKPTKPNDPWTQTIVAMGEDGNLVDACRNYINLYKLDGILMDQVFDHPTRAWWEVNATIRDIEREIAPAKLIVNYETATTYSATKATNIQAFYLRKWFDYAYIQVALSTTTFTTPIWNAIKDGLAQRIGEGQRIIVGVNDPAGVDPKLGALLTSAYEHPRLYWNYTTAVPPAITPFANQWNPWWDL